GGGGRRGEVRAPAVAAVGDEPVGEDHGDVAGAEVVLGAEAAREPAPASGEAADGRPFGAACVVHGAAVDGVTELEGGDEGDLADRLGGAHVDRDLVAAAVGLAQQAGVRALEAAAVAELLRV